MAKDVLEDFIALGGELTCRECEPAIKELRAITTTSWKQLKSAGKVRSCGKVYDDFKLVVVGKFIPL